MKDRINGIIPVKCQKTNKREAPLAPHSKHRKALLSKALQLMILAALFFLAGCSLGTGSQRATANNEDKSATGLSLGDPVKSGLQAEVLASSAVIYQRPEYKLSLPGELKPYQQVAIYAKVAGFVQQLKVDIGDNVHKGQLLAVLEAPEMKQRYLSDKSTEKKLYSNYLYAQKAYERLITAAATKGAVAAGELDQAKAEIEGAKSAYQAAAAVTEGTEQLRDYLQIRAPFSGIITQRNVSTGALAGTANGQPLFIMAQKNKLRLTVTVPEKHAAAIHKGAELYFTVSSMPGREFKAKLSRSATLLDADGRSLTLEFDVDNPDNQLQGGDYAQVVLTLQRGYETYWVPDKSILRTQSGIFVMTLDQGIVRRVPVKEGVRRDSLTEVFGDIHQKDRVLIRPSEEIPEGKVVENSY